MLYYFFIFIIIVKYELCIHNKVNIRSQIILCIFIEFRNCLIEQQILYL
jgi:hypothetical protein